MKASKQIKDFIKDFESLKLTSYLCPAGIWTIGWGHTKNVKAGQNISYKKAIEFFEDDIYNESEKYINEYVKVQLNQNQYDALVSFVFNVGSGNFYTSTLLKRINENNFNEAANQILRWNKAWVDGELKVLPGLSRRRLKEKEIWLKPINIKFRKSYLDKLAIKEFQMIPYNFNIKGKENG